MIDCNLDISKICELNEALTCKVFVRNSQIELDAGLFPEIPTQFEVEKMVYKVCDEIGLNTKLKNQVFKVFMEHFAKVKNWSMVGRTDEHAMTFLNYEFNGRVKLLLRFKDVGA